MTSSEWWTQDPLSRAAILVSSFDGSSDCWAPFFHGLRKYWPGCPFPVYLISNHLDSPVAGVTAMKVRDDESWSTNLGRALVRLDAEFLLYLQEDYWLREPVDTVRVLSYIGLMERHHLDYVRLLSFPKPDRAWPYDARLGLIDAGASYRTSLQVALWRKETLQRLLRPGESAWSFEMAGTERSRGYTDTFLSVWPAGDDEYFHGLRYLCSALNRGRWARSAIAYARTEGIEVDFSRRPVENWWHEFQRRSRWGGLASRTAYRLGLLVRHPHEAVRKSRAWLRRHAPGIF